MKRIRVGVVGVGYFGQFHVEKYAKMEDVELVGVVDIDIKRANEVAKKYGTKFFLHHSELYKKIDAVSIVVPTSLHYTITKEFLLNGIDVLLEKPIANTLEEADELIALSESKGLILQIGHLERFNYALLSIQKDIDRPLFIECQRLSPFTGRETDIDVVLDLMIHDIDIVLNLIKFEIIELRGFGLPVVTSQFDIANGQIKFQDGCIANFTANRVFPEKIRRTWIFESNKVILVDYLSQKASIIKNGKDPKEMKINIEKRDLLEVEIKSFIKSVKHRGNVIVSGRDGKKALEVALRLIEKMSKGKIIN